uniref:Uncharacterized protein n=1 Tax=Salix viminalis TaxID=40686 RepID=A0A6N2LWJ2_SALVM
MCIIKSSPILSATGNCFFFIYRIFTANSIEGSLVLGKLEGNSEIENSSSPKNENWNWSRKLDWKMKNLFHHLCYQLR